MVSLLVQPEQIWTGSSKSSASPQSCPARFAGMCLGYRIAVVFFLFVGWPSKKFENSRRFESYREQSRKQIHAHHGIVQAETAAHTIQFCRIKVQWSRAEESPPKRKAGVDLCDLGQGVSNRSG